MLFIVAGGACSSTPLAQEAVVRDVTPPWLEVRAPLRGTIQVGDASTVLVRGYVEDDRRAVRVTVNGHVAKVRADGGFETTVRADPGITLLHTVATDGAGNAVSDTRAVLGGELVPVTTPVADGVVARLDARAVRAGGELVAQRLGTHAFAAATLSGNPLVNEPLPCFAARADATAVQHAAVNLVVSPVEGGLYVDADVPDLAVGLQVAFSDGCKSTRTETATATARHVRLRGMVRLGVGADGLIAVDRDAASAEIESFAVAGEHVPAAVAAHLEATLADTFTTLVADELAAQVPSALLSGLGSDRKVAVGDNGIELALHPTQLHFDSLGATVAVDSSISLRGGGEAVYLPSAAPRPTLDARHEMALGIADDALNQVLSSLWSAGALDRSLAGEASLYDGIQVFPRLPPTVTALPGGDGLAVVIGDVECVLTRGKQVVGRLSISGELTAGVSVSGQQITLTAVSPRWYVDQVRESRHEMRALTDAQLSRAAGFVTERLVGLVGEMLSHVPLPASSGVMGVADFLGAAPERGYLLVTGDL